MRRLIITDIHGNKEALEAVLSSESYDEVHCLGDVIGYGPDPDFCLRESIDWATLIRGNHELYIQAIMRNFDITNFGIGGNGAIAGLNWTIRNVLQNMTRIGEEPNGCGEDAEEKALTYTKRLLQEAYDSDDTDVVLRKFRLEYLKNLPEQEIITTNLGKALLVHDNPFNPGDSEYMNREDIDNVFYLWDEKWPDIRFIFFGHTHKAVLERRYDRFLVNPGSVGFPRCSPYEAHYAILDDENEVMPVDTFTVPFDWKTTQKKMIEAGLPDKIGIERMHYG